jgi:hypothetical protein
MRSVTGMFTQIIWIEERSESFHFTERWQEKCFLDGRLNKGSHG